MSKRPGGSARESRDDGRSLNGRRVRLGAPRRLVARDRGGRRARDPHSSARDWLDHGLRVRASSSARSRSTSSTTQRRSRPATARWSWACSPAVWSSSSATWVIDRLGGTASVRIQGAPQEDGSALSIVLGTVLDVLDGIPESLVIDLTIYEGGAVDVDYLAAVFISNVPESISANSGLVAGGWKKSRILWMWIGSPWSRPSPPWRATPLPGLLARSGRLRAHVRRRA